VTFLALLYPLTIRYGAPGAAWAGAIAFFIMMINRLRAAASLLPNISNIILRTVLSASLAGALGVALGTLVIRTMESVPARLLLGGSVIAVVVSGVMLALLSQLRVELSRVFTAFKLLLGPRTSRPQ
jgi:uncharacterized protein YacL